MGGMILVLTAALVTAILLQKEEEPEVEVSEGSSAIAICDYVKSDITRIELYSDTEDLIFDYEGTDYAWVLESEKPVTLIQTRVDEIAYTLAELNADLVVETNPTDLAQYGLDHPKVTAVTTYKSGEVVTVYLGNLSSNGSTWYLMREGDPNVYTVWSRHGEHLSYTLDDIRNTSVTTGAFDYTLLQGLILSGRDRKTISIEAISTEDREDIEPNLALAIYKMTEPYAEDRGVLLSVDEEYWSTLPTFTVLRTIKDNATEEDLAEYGLDDPVYDYFVWDSSSNGMHMLVGDAYDDTETYFMKYGDTTVYTVATSELALLAPTAFEMTDKFLLMPKIFDVPKFDITYQGKTTTIDVDAYLENEDDTQYTLDVLLNGKELDADEYKNFYTTFISMYLDAELNEPFDGTPELTIRLDVNDKQGKPYEYVIEYIPYDNDFYAIRYNGVIEFLMSKKQVDALLQTLDFIQ